jgi:hypothetical protein
VTRAEKELEASVKEAEKVLKLTQAALAAFRDKRLNGETVEETHARFLAHEKACKHCSSYEPPDRHCATFSEHVERCGDGGRILEDVNRKKAWPCRSCGLFGERHKPDCFRRHDR